MRNKTDNILSFQKQYDTRYVGHDLANRLEATRRKN